MTLVNACLKMGNSVFVVTDDKRTMLSPDTD